MFRSSWVTVSVPQSPCSEKGIRKVERGRRFSRLLSELGLHRKPTLEELLAFAREVEGGGFPAGSEEIVEQKSKEILGHFLSEKRTQSWWTVASRLREVDFVPSSPLSPTEDEMSEAAPPPRKMIRLSGSLLDTDLYLVWTQERVLPNWVREMLPRQPEEKRELREALGILGKPEPAAVLAHCEAVLQSEGQKKLHAFKFNLPNDPVNSRNRIRALRSFLFAIYRYFGDLLKTGPLEEEDVARLSALPLVAAEERRMLVKAEMVYERCSDIMNQKHCQDLSPFAYQLPHSLHEHKPLFQRLGMTEEPTAGQLAAVLNGMQAHFCRNETPVAGANFVNQVQALMLAFLKLRDFDLSGLEILYLPGRKLGSEEELYLMRSADLLYVDKPIESKSVAIHLAGTFKWETFKVSGDCKWFVSALPEKLRPFQFSRKLSERVTTEDLKECQVEGCQEASRLESLFASEEFLSSLKGIYAEQTDDSDVLPDGGDWVEKTAGFRELRVKCCGSILVSRFFSLPSLGTVPFGPPQARFAFRSAATKEVLISPHGSGSRRFLNCLAEALVDLLPFKPETRAPFKFTDLLSAGSPEECMEMQGPPKKQPKLAIIPELGEPIPASWIRHLILHAGNYFYETEGVGFLKLKDEEGEGEFLLARIVKVIRSGESENGLEEASLEELLHRRYEISLSEDGTDIRTVSAADIYKFVTPPSVEDGELMVSDAANQPRFEEYASRTLKEICEEVTRTLEEAWKLEEEERKKIVRRLFLSWHPDKSEEDQKTVATEVFKHIQQEIRRLERGGSGGPAGDGGGGGSPFDDIFREWARQNFYRQFHQDFTGQSSQSSPGRGRGGSARASYDPSFEAFCRSQPPREHHMAGPFWRQAGSDLEACRRAREAGKWEHTVGHAQQAVEKGVKAALYKRNGTADRSHDIPSLVSGLSGYVYTDLFNLILV